MFDTPRSVTEVTVHIRNLFDEDSLLQDVWVQGEVSNMRPANSGHWYFTLKDDKSQLRCVMWRSAAQRQPVVPQDGDALEVHGKVGLYEPRGEYQLYADIIRPVGVGDLHQQFERLKAQLAEEGLFDRDHKGELPLFPLRIGVVTSPTAAAFQDVLNVLARRFPLAEVILSPTLVQGNEAPPQIIRAVQRLNEYSDVDVIIVCRGGGSIEDLWAFNDEGVARAIAASRIPTITGIGHETDFTIADFVSDDRAPTPSAAAEHATPDIYEINMAVRTMDSRLKSMMLAVLDEKKDDLYGINRTLGHISPLHTIQMYRQRIDDHTNRIINAQERLLKLRQERLTSKINALNAANPRALLERGYAIVTRSEGNTRISSADDAPPGTGLTITLKDGEIKARSEDKDIHERYTRTLF